MKSKHDIPLPARFGQQMGITGHLYTAMIARLLEPHDLTYAQFTVLLHLLRRTQPARMADICRAVELNQPAVSKVIQKFISKGWVVDTPDRDDGRARRLEITAAGRACAVTVQQAFGPAFAQLLDVWDPAALERLITDLERLAARLDQMRPQTTTGG